jgi:hypothetical protein
MIAKGYNYFHKTGIHKTYHTNNQYIVDSFIFYLKTIKNFTKKFDYGLIYYIKVFEDSWNILDDDQFISYLNKYPMKTILPPNYDELEKVLKLSRINKNRLREAAEFHPKARSLIDIFMKTGTRSLGSSKFQDFWQFDCNIVYNC